VCFFVSVFLFIHILFACAAYVGAGALFGISSSNFTNCSANGGGGSGTGGAIYTISEAEGIILLVDLIFSMNSAGSFVHFVFCLLFFFLCIFP
jgi:hypothetical protein